MRTILIGVVGCGQVAQRVYLPEFHRLQDKATLVAVCDRLKSGQERPSSASVRAPTIPISTVFCVRATPKSSSI